MAHTFSTQLEMHREIREMYIYAQNKISWCDFIFKALSLTFRYSFRTPPESLNQRTFRTLAVSKIAYIATSVEVKGIVKNQVIHYFLIRKS